MSVFRMPPPVWFWIVAGLLLVWGLMGVGGFVADRMLTDATVAAMSDYDRQLRAATPAWTVWTYGIATIAGLVGSVLLLLRRRAARPAYAASLVAVVVLFGYMLSATDLIAAKGFVGAAGFPIVIVVIGVFQVWLAGRAERRGWIG